MRSNYSVIALRDEAARFSITVGSARSVHTAGAKSELRVFQSLKAPLRQIEPVTAKFIREQIDQFGVHSERRPGPPTDQFGIRRSPPWYETHLVDAKAILTVAGLIV